MSRGNKDMMYNPKAFPSLIYTKAFCRSRYKDMIYNSKPFPLCIKLKAFCKNTSRSKIIFTKAFPELQLSLHNPSINPN